MSNSLNDNDDNKIGDDTIDEGKEEKEDDARAWLQMELGGVAGHLASASLQSCARFVAEKTLLDVVWAASSQEGQGQGLGPAGRALHIDIAYTTSVDEPLFVATPMSASAPAPVPSSTGASDSDGRTHVQLFLPLAGRRDERMSDAAVIEGIQRVAKMAVDAVQQSGPLSLVVISVLPYPDSQAQASENHRNSDKRISQRSSFGNDMVPRWNHHQHSSMNASPLLSEVNRLPVVVVVAVAVVGSDDDDDHHMISHHAMSCHAMPCHISSYIYHYISLHLDVI